MPEYLIALALTLMPAIGNFAGGLLAELFTVSARLLNLALHLAAGIVLAVVSIELMPQALQVDQNWIVILAFVAGGGFAVLLDQLVGLVQRKRAADDNNTKPWMIFLGTSIDLFTDGLIIGAGSTVNFGLGFLLALGQVPADIPEGFATIATLKDANIPRQRRLFLSASFALPIFLGATIGFWAVRGQPDLLKFGLLAFASGILIAIAVEEMVVSAHESLSEAGLEEGRLATVVLVCGFALFAFLTTYFE